jgi:hypothetical protein
MQSKMLWMENIYEPFTSIIIYETLEKNFILLQSNVVDLSKFSISTSSLYSLIAFHVKCISCRPLRVYSSVYLQNIFIKPRFYMIEWKIILKYTSIVKIHLEIDWTFKSNSIVELLNYNISI